DLPRPAAPHRGPGPLPLKWPAAALAWCAAAGLRYSGTEAGRAGGGRSMGTEGLCDGRPIRSPGRPRRVPPPAGHATQTAPGRATGGAAQVAPSRRHCRGGRVALADGLTFRIISPPAQPGAQQSPGDTFAAQAATVAEAFRLAFLRVWTRLPDQDRACLLAYWRRLPERRLRAGPGARPSASPQIRVVAGVRWSPAYPVGGELGTEL